MIRQDGDIIINAASDNYSYQLIEVTLSGRMFDLAGADRVRGLRRYYFLFV